MIICAKADIPVAQDLIFALRFRGYDASFPPVVTDGGRTVGLALWSKAINSDAPALFLFESCAAATELLPTIVLRLCDAPLPLFARDLPSVGWFDRPAPVIVDDIEAVLSRLQPVALQATPAGAERSYRSALPVFISHASEDLGEAKWLHYQLRQAGFAPWLDAIDLLPGQDWEYEIRAVIRRAAAVVTCLSERSVSKFGYVQKELRLALDAADEAPDGAVFVIPLRLDDCEVPPRLRHLHWIDRVDSDTFSSLVRVLDDCLRRRVTKDGG
jgi:hypothetical protein